MSPELLFSIATLAGWLGWLLVARAALNGLRLAANSPGIERDKVQRAAITSTIFAVALLLISRFTPGEVGREIEGTGIKIPVVWFYTHFWGWACVLGAFFTSANAIQTFLSITPQERRVKLYWVLGWLGFTIVSLFVFKKIEAQVIVFRGAFFLSPATLGIFILLIALCLAFMAFTARRATTRSFSKTFWTHAVLIAGCFIFGLPFAWLLSSSFKEDKDMAGGIIWIPRVTETVPYLDPKEPQYAGTFQGVAVTATPMESLPDDNLKLDILTPLSMRGQTFEAFRKDLKLIPKQVPVVTGKLNAVEFRGKVIEELANGDRKVEILSPESVKGQVRDFTKEQVVESRPNGLRWQNYPEALQYLPPETQFGLVYLKNTLILVVMGVIGTILSCAIVAYAFSRMRFPGREFLFKVLLATMMLPGAVTLMPQFLIFKSLGWIDTLNPLWVPAFFAGAFNVFMLRQFFNQIPMELEDAAKIDGCSYIRAFWSVMMPQVKPALAVIAIWTFMGTWNNFMGPLIYINSPENMPIAYALQLFNGDRGGEPGLLMAFATLTMLPVLALFFFAQKYFIEGVTLSGLGGR